MGYTSDASDEEALLRARVEDACHLCDSRSCPRFVGFLDEHRQAVARVVLQKRRQAVFLFYGGYDGAERTILGVFPEFIPLDTALFPLRVVGFRYRPSADLNHRDILGSLLAAGLKREVIGDIICSAGHAVVFLAEEIAPFVAQTVTRIGREGVTCEYPYGGEVTASRSFRDWQDTVATPRLDAVLRAALKVSREEAARRIENGAVSLNHMPCLSVSRTVEAGDCLSVRGSGRFLVDEIGPQTKKGRYILKIRQYL